MLLHILIEETLASLCNLEKMEVANDKWTQFKIQKSQPVSQCILFEEMLKHSGEEFDETFEYTVYYTPWRQSNEEVVLVQLCEDGDSLDSLVQMEMEPT